MSSSDVDRCGPLEKLPEPVSPSNVVRKVRLSNRRVIIPPPPARVGGRDEAHNAVALCRNCHKQPAETRYAVRSGLCEDCFALAEAKHHKTVATRQPLRTTHTEV
jgi:hypothetical protein